MIQTISKISYQNQSLVIFPSPFTSKARTKLSISAKEGSQTLKAIAKRLISCPNSFFSKTPDLSVSKLLKAEFNSFLATAIMISVSFPDLSYINKIQQVKDAKLIFLCSRKDPPNIENLFIKLFQDPLINSYIEMAQKKINGYMIFMKDVLGRGSYGSVYRGEQDGTKKECAIKVVEKRSIDHDDYLKNALFSEIQIMQMLKSENIVRVMDVMESSNNYYIVQELCDSDLEKMIKIKRKLPEQEAIECLKQICNGFITLTKQGIVHRDIKPANLLISKGVVKIGDFGFAKKNLTKRMRNASAVGTPLYWPLQILKSESYTSKCDIWAIGFIFYEMLHGKTPWSASTEFQLIKSIQEKPLVIKQDLSEETKDFLMKTLMIEQEERISWDEVFLHPIFKGQFDHYAKQTHEFEDKLKRVMGELRFEINSKNIDLDRLIDGLGFKNNKELNYQEFTQFLKHIHPKITNKEINFFFQKMDINADGSISMKELQTEMERHRISFSRSAEQKNKFMKQFSSLATQGEQIIPTELQMKVKRCFLKLNKILTAKKLSLYATFNAYDTDRNGQMTIVQFEKIMKRLDSTLTEEELIAIFNFIDTDQSKSIEFEELNSYYCKVNGIPPELTLPSKMKKQ